MNIFGSSHYDFSLKTSWPLTRENRFWLGEIHKAFDQGKLEFERTNCPLCQTEDHETVCERDRYGINVTTVLCSKCGLVYRKKRLAEKSAGVFYNEYYQGLFKGTLSPLEYFNNQKKHAQYIYDFTRSRLPENGYMIEVGCGPGGILSFFQERGFKVRGYDLDSSYSQYDIPDKPEVLPGDIQSVLDKKERPDFIILSHVLEHTFRPLELLRTCNRILNDNGLIFVEVPGLRSFKEGHYSMCGSSQQHPYQMDLLQEIVLAHNFEFDISTLSHLLAKSNFKILRSTELIRLIGKKIDQNSAVVSLEDNYQRNRKYLLDLERVRRSYAKTHRLRIACKKIKHYVRAASDRTALRTGREISERA